MVFKPILNKKEVCQIMTQLKKALKKAGFRDSRLILFGSYAMNKPRPWSDIDVCVLSNQFGRRDYDDMVKVSRIAKKVNYLIEAHPLNSKDYVNSAHPLADEIKRKGKAYH